MLKNKSKNCGISIFREIKIVGKPISTLDDKFKSVFRILIASLYQLVFLEKNTSLKYE